MGVGVAVASVALGATVVEKHFTLARADGGVDSKLGQKNLRLWLATQKGLGRRSRVRYGPTEAERKIWCPQVDLCRC